MATDGELTAEQVAEFFAQAVRVTDRYYEDLGFLQDDRQPLSRATVARLKRLLAMVEPASQVRLQLGSISTELLFAGLHLWAKRQQTHEAPALPLWAAAK